MSRKFNRYLSQHQSIKEQSLRDTYVKTQIKQYQRIQKNIRTKHK